MKNVDNRRKKEKRDNLDTHEKVLFKNYEKKDRGNCVITLMMIKENRLDNNKNRKKNQRVEIKDERKQVFDNVYSCSMIDSFILTTPAFKITEEDFKSAIPEGPITSEIYVGNLNFERMLLN